MEALRPGARWIIPFDKLKMERLRTQNGEAAEDFVVPLSRQAVALLLGGLASGKPSVES
ncbi:hypothetical protein [Bradyrhizobium sp. STM 3557]|uniref:hypothetical protein n=1 Tax=Bradyrhizobium sp. STM 3557 TaxID=578920 RepID=UPI0038910744